GKYGYDRPILKDRKYRGLKECLRRYGKVYPYTESPRRCRCREVPCMSPPPPSPEWQTTGCMVSADRTVYKFRIPLKGLAPLGSYDPIFPAEMHQRKQI